MSWTTRGLLLSVFACTLWLNGSQVGAEEPDLQGGDLFLVPVEVPIGFFFNEGRVSVTGTLPSGCEAALIVQGRNQETTMNIRGRKLGLWMTVGRAKFDDAPAFYQCLTSKPVAEIASPETATENGLSLETIKGGIKVNVEGEGRNARDEDRRWKEEFIEFKKARGLFSVQEGALAVIAGQGGVEKIQGEIVFPARSPEGDYRVLLVGLKDGKSVARIEGTVSVTLMPAVAFLRDLAMDHGWLYGILAVVVALLAGIGVGALMPSKGGGH